tara:strand:- start:523 stop:948 length:426 start_codon:yes stop_codon:yes gene_type:complete
MVLSIDSFALKIVKKAEEAAFSNKAKIVNINIPEKIKIFIQENLSKEIDHFKRKYKLEFNLISDKNLILPEYIIVLQNKNKKVIKKIEHIEKVEKNTFQNNFKKNKFSNKKFIKRSKFKKNYGYRQKSKKGNFDNNKVAGY